MFDLDYIFSPPMRPSHLHDFCFNLLRLLLTKNLVTKEEVEHVFGEDYQTKFGFGFTEDIQPNPNEIVETQETSDG